MSELRFRIAGDANDRVRWERRLRPPSHSPALVVVGLAVAGSVYVGNAAPAGDAELPVALVHNTEVCANHVLVLIDNSGSTRGTEPARDCQLNQLAAANIRIDRQTFVDGYALSFTYRYAFLTVFERELAAAPEVDMLYLISDFWGGDDAYNEPVGWDYPIQAAEARPLRLYFASVNADPAPRYYDIARRFGGDVIPAM